MLPDGTLLPSDRAHVSHHFRRFFFFHSKREREMKMLAFLLLSRLI